MARGPGRREGGEETMKRKSLEERAREIEAQRDKAIARRKSRMAAKRAESQRNRKDSGEADWPDNWTIYFVQSGDGGPIKIGRTRDNPLSRMDALQCGHPYTLRLLAVISHCKASVESDLHRRFYHLHVRGEWFRPEGELLAFIRDNAVAWMLPRDRVPNWWFTHWDLRTKEMVEDAMRFPEHWRDRSLGIWETYDDYLAWRESRLKESAN
jgi:hypothetical protein